MKKLRPDLPWSDIESADELRSTLAALDGDPQQLSARLRDGLASKIERTLAADLLERKIKPRRSRPGSHREACLMVAVLIRLLEKLWTVPNMEGAYYAALPYVPPPNFRNWQRKTILHSARKIVGQKSKVMSERQAYNALDEFDEAAVSQLKKPLRHMLLTPDPEMEALIQALLTPDSEIQMNPPDDDDDEQDELPDPDVKILARK
jgi:hypothetical protein